MSACRFQNPGPVSVSHHCIALHKTITATNKKLPTTIALTRIKTRTPTNMTTTNIKNKKRAHQKQNNGITEQPTLSRTHRDVALMEVDWEDVDEPFIFSRRAESSSKSMATATAQPNKTHSLTSSARTSAPPTRSPSAASARALLALPTPLPLAGGGLVHGKTYRRATPWRKPWLSRQHAVHVSGGWCKGAPCGLRSTCGLRGSCTARLSCCSRLLGRGPRDLHARRDGALA